MAKQRESEIPDQSEIKRTKGEIRERVAHESTRRARLGVPAFAGGVLYLLGSITTNASLKKLPTVGVVQGIAPALSGQVNPAISPRAAEVRFYDHNAFGLLAGAVVDAVALSMLLALLLFLFEAARFRRPQTTPVARWLVLVGGIALPVLTVLGGIVQAIDAHNFVTGHDFSTHAVEHALTKNVAYEILGYVTPLSAIALVAGMVGLMVSTVRIGLQPRWLGIVGGASAVILLVPTQELSVITAFWMVAMGLLLLKRWPVDPPAWAAGEARPWSSPSAARTAREERRGGGGGSAKGVGGSKGGGKAKGDSASKETSKQSRSEALERDVTPDPVQPTASDAGSRRRRKRGSRK